MGAIDTVIFDLGEVLIPWDPRRLYRKIFADEAAMERFLAEVCTSDWNARQDAGRSLADGTRERIDAFPQFEEEIRDYYGRWAEMLGEPIEGSVNLVHTLKRNGYRVFALSNWSAETFPLARARYPVLEAFDGIVVSGFEGMIKPDPAIYRLLCDRYAIRPESAVFIDDNPANVAGAERLGMQGIRFTSPAQARAELAALGVAV